MTELEFVLLDRNATLRDLVDKIAQQLAGTERAWYTYYALVRSDGGYLGIRLTELSAMLAQGQWTLDTLVGTLALAECAVVQEGTGERAIQGANAPLVVAERDGQPAALYVGRSMRGAARVDRSGWWRLVGRRWAEQGRRPEWPASMPSGYAYRPVVAIDSELRLFELAERLQAMPEGKDAVLAIADREGEWRDVVPADRLLQRITQEYKDAAPDSMVGAFVAGEGSALPTLERRETPWRLVEELISASQMGAVQYLVTEGGTPTGILSASRVLRGGPSGAVPKAAAASWARFQAEAAGMETAPGAQGRVVNTWFANQQRSPVPYTHALAANRLYHVAVSIGSPDDKAHVIGDIPALDAQLVSYLIGKGTPLTLRLDSQDLIVLDPEQSLSLPKGGSTEQIYFRVATPVHTGVGRLSLAIYYENNLVQAYSIHVRVAPAEGPMPEGAGEGWWTKCVYTLSSDFTNLSDLDEPRRVCVWIGQGGDEALRTGITESTGMNLGPPLDVNTQLIDAALDRYRQLLRKACFEDPESENPTYRYGETHEPLDEKTFRTSVLDLAEMGQGLYDRVFGTERGRRVAECLREVEGEQREPLVVQIARLSLDAAFPWSVLYDRPLRYNPGRNSVCTACSEREDCRSSCPQEGDPLVVCPYGFWGYRYIIEQPLRPPDAFSSLVTRLRVQDRPDLALVYGSGLGLTEHHREKMTGVIRERAKAAVYADTDGLLSAMRTGPAAVYFYCHGGNTAFRQWLVVGKDDPLMPSYLDEDMRTAWAKRAPLIVLNGCHTAKYDPSTLLSFVHRFGGLGAAGVIGTEIPIHEYLGDAFGQFLMERLLSGEAVGKIVRDFRRDLLGKRNVLGLAYVPYCYADLRIEQA